MIKSHEIVIIVCTTVLERGMTVENVQVIILHGEHPLFDKEILIQIAGQNRAEKYPIQMEILSFIQIDKRRLLKNVSRIFNKAMPYLP